MTLEPSLRLLRFNPPSRPSLEVVLELERLKVCEAVRFMLASNRVVEPVLSSTAEEVFGLWGKMEDMR